MTRLAVLAGGVEGRGPCERGRQAGWWEAVRLDGLPSPLGLLLGGPRVNGRLTTVAERGGLRDRRIDQPIGLFARASYLPSHNPFTR